MKIKLKSEVKDAKTFDYVLHTLEVTEANILDYIKFDNLFHSPDWDTCRWEELMLENDIPNYPSTKNLKENSFDLEIDDYENKLLPILKQFLTNNQLEYEN